MERPSGTLVDSPFHARYRAKARSLKRGTGREGARRRMQVDHKVSKRVLVGALHRVHVHRAS